MLYFEFFLSKEVSFIINTKLTAKCAAETTMHKTEAIQIVFSKQFIADVPFTHTTTVINKYIIIYLNWVRHINHKTYQINRNQAEPEPVIFRSSLPLILTTKL